VSTDITERKGNAPRWGLVGAVVSAVGAPICYVGPLLLLGVGIRGARLPKCNSMRTCPGLVEPEVYFRIVHATRNGHKGAPVAAYREQMVEIALRVHPISHRARIGTA
jgi:hypothetical protein